MAISFTAFLDVDQVDRLQRDDRVKLLTENTSYGLEYSVAPPWSDSSPISPPNPNSAEVRTYGHIAMNGVFSADSSYPRIYIVDAGVGYHYDGFEPTASNVQRVNPIGASAVGCYSHATFVASVVGATGNNGYGTVGIVPNAPIVSVSVSKFTVNDPPTGKVCAQSKDVDSIGTALDWVKQDILGRGFFLAGIVNLSQNFNFDPANPSTNPYQPGGTLNIKMQNLATPAMGSGFTYPGAFIVQSAGNQNDDACAHAYSPANSADGIMVIGGVNSSGYRVSTGYNGYTTLVGAEPGSNYGSCVEAYAPSQYIYGAWGPLLTYGDFSPDSWQDQSTTYNNYTKLDGTSFAAPHVAGVAAYLMRARGLNTSVQVEAAVRSTLYTSGITDGFGNYIYYPQIQ